MGCGCLLAISSLTQYLCDLKAYITATLFWREIPGKQNPNKKGIELKLYTAKQTKAACVTRTCFWFYLLCLKLVRFVIFEIHILLKSLSYVFHPLFIASYSSPLKALS